VRTSPSITQNEVDAYAQFAAENKIITDGAVGVKNADILCNPIINRDSDITPATLSASFAKVRSQLRMQSPTYKKADELARKLSPDRPPQMFILGALQWRSFHLSERPYDYL
jgi:hypothetical protein